MSKYDRLTTMTKPCLISTERLLHAALWLLLALSAGYARSDDFCGDPRLSVTLNAQIPILGRANFSRFIAAHEWSQQAEIRDLSEIAQSLINENKSSLLEVSQFLRFLGDFYQSMLNLSDESIGRALSDEMLAHLDRLYFQHKVPLRRIHFVRVDPEHTSDYALFGSYDYLGGKTLRLSIRVLNLNSLEQRVFSATGTEVAASKLVAQQIFDAFQLTKNDSAFNPLSKRVFIATDGSQLAKTTTAVDAAGFCSMLNARVPTRTELKLADWVGPYVSGIQLLPDKPYFVMDEGRLSTMILASDECLPVPNYEQIQAVLVCIK